MAFSTPRVRSGTRVTNPQICRVNGPQDAGPEGGASISRGIHHREDSYRQYDESAPRSAGSRLRSNIRALCGVALMWEEGSLRDDGLSVSTSRGGRAQSRAGGVRHAVSSRNVVSS